MSNSQCSAWAIRMCIFNIALGIRYLTYLRARASRPQEGYTYVESKGGPIIDRVTQQPHYRGSIQVTGESAPMFRFRLRLIRQRRQRS